MFQKFRNKARELAGKATAAASLLLVGGAASAQTVDGASIVTMIEGHQAVGLMVAGAGTIAILAVKYAKLPRAA